MDTLKYPHLYLKDWPFQTVPDEKFATIWAGHKNILENIHHILRALIRREQSTINLIWAWYGAGKSHTLKHLQHLGRKNFPQLIPVYIEYPKTARSYLDLYYAFINALGRETLEKLAGDVLLGADLTPIARESADFVRFMETLISGTEEEKDLAYRWIKGSKALPAKLKKKGFEKKIETSDDAIRTVAALVKTITVSSTFHRILFMIDEFQRVSSERTEVWEDINAGLHSTFNHCPHGFSLFLSFSIRESRKIFSYLSRELIDRVGIQKIIAIPNFSIDEAMNFVGDLLFEFRSDAEYPPSPYFPFEEDAVKYILWLIREKSDLKPRAIMQYFNAVLERAEANLARGEQKSIDLPYAKTILADYDLFLSFQKESLLLDR